MTTREVLQRARERIARGKCSFAYARDEVGEKTAPDDPTAVSWCARGALGSLAVTAEKEAAAQLLCQAIGIKRFELYRWNDKSDQAVVLACLDRALKLCDV